MRDSQTYEGAFGLAVKVDSPPASVLKQVDGDVCKFFQRFGYTQNEREREQPESTDISYFSLNSRMN